MASLLDDNIYSSFKMDSHIKGYHDYKDIWTPSPNEMLKAVPEPTNVVDKYAVCVLIGEVIVGHLKKGKTGRFAKTIFYFLRADEKGSCAAIVRGKAVNLGDGEGMQVPCTLHFKGTPKYINVLQQQLEKLEI